MLHDIVARFKEQHEMLQRSKKFLFKGLDPDGFKHYFRRGGVSPRSGDRDWTWITNHYGRAVEFAHANPIYGDATCLAIFDGSVQNRKHLKPTGCDAVLFAPGIHDFYGDEVIRWDEMVRLLTTPHVLTRIKTHYNNIQPTQIQWDKFQDKVTFVEPGSVRALNNNIYSFLKKAA